MSSYTITNEAGRRVVTINADIGGEGFTLDAFNKAIDGAEGVPLVRLKTNGGDLLEAFSIYDAIKNLPSGADVEIFGATASAGSIISAAGKSRRITKNSRYLVHWAESGVQGNKTAVKALAAQLESFDMQLLDIYKPIIKKPVEDLIAQMDKGDWITAEEALEWGFVTEIINNDLIINTKQTFYNMKKFQNLTEEEQAEMDALLAENEGLKAQIAELQSKLDEIDAAKAEKDMEEVEEEVDNAIATNKISNESKEAWIAFGKTNKQDMMTAIRNIVTPAPVEPAARHFDNIKKRVPPADGVITVEQFNKNLKDGVYKNNQEKARIDFKAAFGREMS